MMSFRLAGVDAVGFDLDGTLLDHPAAASAGVRALMQSVGLAHTPAHDELWFEAELVHFRREG